MASLGIQQGMCVLDVGCGTGEALQWLADEVGPEGTVIGMDLATAHLAHAHALASGRALVFQADLQAPPLAPATVDLVWAVNTFNHLHDPVLGLKAIIPLLRPGGRIALGQSSLLPDMYFAWDSRLERLTNEAVRQYYRDRYQVSERDLAAVRSLVGWLRSAGLCGVVARTFTIDRIAPLEPADEHYLVETIFRQTWGARLKPYLPTEDYEHLMRLCDPQHPEFALDRLDFHFVQSFTMVTGELPDDVRV
jgi:SAM-dependent methyltransferase